MVQHPTDPAPAPAHDGEVPQAILEALRADVDATAPGPDRTLIATLATLVHPDDQVARADYAHTLTERLDHGAYTPTDDALMDELRHQRDVLARTQATIRLLVAYARTAAPEPSRYPLRVLADALGAPLSTVRTLPDEDAYQALQELLDLTDEQADAVVAEVVRLRASHR